MKRILFALISTFSLFAQDVPKLTLTASASIPKPADELQLKIGVVTYAETAEAALADNNSRMNRVFDDLMRAGLDRDDYETNQFSINPTYTPTPKDPPPHWKPSINGYEVRNTLQIHTPKLDMAGTIIDLANKAGANSITDIHFGLRNSRNYWTEALSAAGANAVSDAQAIANATGVRLIRVLNISLNHTQVKSPPLNFCAARPADFSTPIEAGDVSIEASVTLIYEIGN
ncbi:MAG: SIMPL domain-containing protein [Parachlamydiales bacterium]|nr:SIMPL domain-containing protein [Parachlamydiales bacterium]